jgi:1,2-phenylacetyl-CoA epoxidase PaaB subunit
VVKSITQIKLKTYEIDIQPFPSTFTVKANNPEDAYDLAKDLFFLKEPSASIYSHSVEEINE